MIKLKRLLIKEYGNSSREDVSKALADIRRLGFENPFDGSTVIGGNTMVEMSYFDGHLWMSSIYSTERGKGNAGAVMAKICSIADKHGVYMALSPKPFGQEKGLNTGQLKTFYKKYGFKDIGMGMMERTPK